MGGGTMGQMGGIKITIKSWQVSFDAATLQSLPSVTISRIENVELVEQKTEYRIQETGKTRQKSKVQREKPGMAVRSRQYAIRSKNPCFFENLASAGGCLKRF